ncbi:flagellar motor switch protein FliN [Halomonas urumqiensis]|uniref:Flagellar motor switch protein FliN n=1 Tax=Halomonas urumqiensis TaxID=1684789 RepID=A0A2N7UNQ7_9GAMM|nr:flagellar motor switch protein FliN [Halomonas urumqiensis]PMR82080.1 flagellar motor switch protein FliN [Halomonas urumqiensis]PTB02588.1 flagellar motor switch protein FliN [Halomonas urumqiensis]GHE21069.1 flagellar motor switch protein FliN [Halomonas urumqiensis]
MTDPKKPDQNIDDDWAAAMSEQEQSEQEQAEQQGTGDDDPWAAAMAEQAEAEAQAETPSEPDAEPNAQSASDSVFRPLAQSAGGGASRDLEMIMDIPVKLAVELGRTRITIKQLLELAQGSVIELDGLAGEPMDILINGYLIAQGEVVVVDDKYGIRITEIITPSERVQKLNR